MECQHIALVWQSERTCLELYRWDTGRSEIDRIWEDITYKGHKLWYNGEDARHKHGEDTWEFGQSSSAVHPYPMSPLSKYLLRLPGIKTIKWRSSTNSQDNVIKAVPKTSLYSVTEMLRLAQK